MAVAFGGLTQAVGFGPPALNFPSTSGSDIWGLFFMACDAEGVSVTIDGVAMTKLQGGSAGFASADYALFQLQNPTSGGAIVVTDPAVGLANNYIATYYTGVGSIRGSAEGAGSSTTATLSQTTVANDWAVGVLYDLSEALTPTVGTARGSAQTDGDGGVSRWLDNIAAGATTDFTGTFAGSTPWISVGAVLVPAGGGGGPGVGAVRNYRVNQLFLPESL